MTQVSRFRPCIDLHEGQVKQIVGGSLRQDRSELIENHVSQYSADYFANLFQRDGLYGGHLIQLGRGNEIAAQRALAAFPKGLQLGGGVCLENASQWLEAGAEKVIVTSWLFDESGNLQEDRLNQLLAEIGAERLVIDLSCRRVGAVWKVAIHRWQTITDLEINHANLDWLANSASEFLIHAADVEGLCQGFDAELVRLLASWRKRPITYAGGIASMEDVRAISSLSQGNLDFTVGSALDLFGGHGVSYHELLAWNRQNQTL